MCPNASERIKAFIDDDNNLFLLHVKHQMLEAQSSRNYLTVGFIKIQK